MARYYLVRISRDIQKMLSLRSNGLDAAQRPRGNVVDTRTAADALDRWQHLPGISRAACITCADSSCRSERDSRRPEWGRIFADRVFGAAKIRYHGESDLYYTTSEL